MVASIDPNTIENESVRQIVIDLMNLVEKLSAQVAQLTAENQQLRDENKRLKGEQGKPKIRGNKKASDQSSEKERKESKSHDKSSKQGQLKIDREVYLKVDRKQLPADAVFKGYEEVVLQDLEIQTDNVKFHKEKYYSKSMRRTYLAELPAGYNGQFGPKVRALVLALYYESGMSEPKILDLLLVMGLSISAGELSNLLIKDQDLFHAESAAIVKAGLSSAPWHHLDSTATRVNGINQHCHVLCNQLYSFYVTLPYKDRRSYLRVLLGGAALTFRYGAQAVQLLTQLGVSAKWVEQLAGMLPAEVTLTEEQVTARLEEIWPRMGPNVRKNILDALAIAAYHSQTSYPIVNLLVCDDAPQFNLLTALLALCWIHEYRHYKQLIPRFSHHIALLQAFGKQFWQLYKGLQDYREHPTSTQAAALEAEFEQLFAHKSGYDQLDEYKARTLKKRDQLLMVLIHPEILLHNNPAELGARQRVRKRDVSLQARTPDGIHAWDTFQTLVATAKKLGINIFHYFQDRILGTGTMPALATLIREQAQLLQLGASWQLGP
jgi:regulator of replication initiation timing